MKSKSKNGHYRNEPISSTVEVTASRSKQMFDLDLTEGYFNLEKLLETAILKPGAIPAKEFLSRSKEMIEVVMNDQGREMPQVLTPADFVVIDHTAGNYVGGLGFVLLSYEPIRIPLLLNEQKKKYKGPFAFWKIVGTTVLNYVINNSPFENEKRAIIIRDWALVEEKNTHEKPSKKKNKTISFSAYFANPNPQLIDFLKEQLNGATANKFITMFSALIRAGYISKHNVRSMTSFYVTCTNEFGELCGKTKFNDDLKMLINNDGIRPPEENEWVTLINEYNRSLQK